VSWSHSEFLESDAGAALTSAGISTVNEAPLTHAAIFYIGGSGKQMLSMKSSRLGALLWVDDRWMPEPFIGLLLLSRRAARPPCDKRHPFGHRLFDFLPCPGMLHVDVQTPAASLTL
jgi:hypothetical protein